MLFIWSGLGVLTLPIVALTVGITVALGMRGLEAIGRPDLAYLAFSLGLLLAAAVNWVVGRRLNRAPGRELVDPSTGERVVLRRRHTLFWIPMEYLSVLLALAALVPLLALLGGKPPAAPM